jgi:2'-5' RNA ligase
MQSQVHRLFFALRPDAELLREIERTAQGIKAMNVLRGRWLKPQKFHLTVHFLGDFSAPDSVITRSKAAAGCVACAPFEFMLDHVISFARRFNPPCVLRCAPDSERALRAFRSELGTALAAEGLGEHLEPRFAPHLTIAYGDKALVDAIPIAPIRWVAQDFVLMDSFVGQGIHTELARWPLRA